MFIAGAKNQEKKIGYHAEFCPMCRGIEAAEVVRLSTVGHIYFIPLGRGTHVGTRLKCVGCETITYSDVSEPLRVIPQCQSLDQLIAQTNPTLEQDVDKRLRLEAVISKGDATLPPEIRRKLIQEPFYHLNDDVKHNMKKGPRFDGLALACLMVFFGWIALMVFAGPRLMEFPPIRNLLNQIGLHGLVAAILSTVALGMFLLAALFIGHRFRYVNIHVCPRLAEALAPLRPTRAELEETRRELKSTGLKTGKFSVDKLVDDLSARSGVMLR